MRRISLLFTAGILLSAPAGAQERLGSGAPTPAYRAGWTLTPTLGFAETYDDNISLSGRGPVQEQNNDYVNTVFPGADLHFSGKHTLFDIGYTGSFLNYQTFSSLNRWDQRGHLELRRAESARVKWFARANAAQVPSTDFVELGGVPFRRTGARTGDARGGVEYLLGSRDSISGSAGYQRIDFDRTDDVRTFLRGGHVFEMLDTWRHKLDERLELGADYSFRRAEVVGDTEQFDLHSTQAAIGYELSSLWSLSGAAGIVFMMPTSTLPARTGPAWRIAIGRHRAGRTFHAAYLRSYIPSFGFGGMIQNQEAGAGFRTPLFGSRRFYTDHSAVFRDDKPLTPTLLTLPLRSFRTYSIVGWEPGGWVRLEAFYARTQQTSLRAGGQIERNRIGFQIVTSKPVRVQ